MDDDILHLFEIIRDKLYPNDDDVHSVINSILRDYEDMSIFEFNNEVLNGEIDTALIEDAIIGFELLLDEEELENE